MPYLIMLLIAVVVVALGLLVKRLSDFGRDIDVVTHPKGRAARG